MKHFVTIFPAAKNVHLIKDVGQIPYQMQKHFDYHSTLVCHKNEEHYPYLEKEVKGLKVDFLTDKGRRFFWEKAVVSYLLKKARSIDVLNLYHLSQASMLYGMLYKWLNPNGVLFLKLDFNLSRYKQEGFQFSTNAIKNKIHTWFLKPFLRKTDIISVETREAEKILKKENSFFKNRLIYLPNGVDDTHLNDAENGVSKKENVILTVGRIGLPDKNHEVLLQAILEADLSDWNIIFAGPVRESFKPKVEQFFEENIVYRSRVQFVGEITDRATLYSFYKRAKIFCLPSKSEGFPMALIEALSFGNYVVGTDTITSIKEVTQQGAFGHIIPAGNTHALSKALEEVTKPGFYTPSTNKNIYEHSQKYRWDRILKDLNQQLDKITKNE